MIITLLFTVFAAALHAQHQFALNLGYKYNRINSGYVGAEYRLDKNSNKSSHGPLNVGIGSHLYADKRSLTLLPEIHVNKTWKHFLITELSVSPQYINPNIGITFFNFTRLQFGYAVPLQQSEFKGFSFGLHILIGRSPFYDEITIY